MNEEKVKGILGRCTEEIKDEIIPVVINAIMNAFEKGFDAGMKAILKNRKYDDQGEESRIGGKSKKY